MSFQAINFKEDEFKCPCCGKVEMDQEFITKLDAARIVSGVPYIITSGCRCEKHNKTVGSTSDNHIKGVAAHIQCRLGHTRLKIVQGLTKAGFKRIGIGQSFVHCDVNNREPSLWIY